MLPKEINLNAAIKSVPHAFKIITLNLKQKGWFLLNSACKKNKCILLKEISFYCRTQKDIYLGDCFLKDLILKENVF